MTTSNATRTTLSKTSCVTRSADFRACPRCVYHPLADKRRDDSTSDRPKTAGHRLPHDNNFFISNISMPLPRLGTLRQRSGKRSSEVSSKEDKNRNRKGPSRSVSPRNRASGRIDWIQSAG